MPRRGRTRTRPATPRNHRPRPNPHGLKIPEHCGQNTYPAKSRGDYVERMIADRVMLVAQRMGLTPRTVLSTYVTEDQVRQWGTDLAVQLRDAELAAHDTPPIEVEQDDGLMVLAAFGVCGALALRNAGRRDNTDPMIVAKDAADSTVQVAVSLRAAAAEPAQIGGLDVVIGRKVIGMALEALRTRRYGKAGGNAPASRSTVPMPDVRSKIG